MSYLPAPGRYDGMTYRFCGRSGLRLPLLSLGLWHNFGDFTPAATQREIVLHGVRPGHHPLRPGQQLRPAVRQRRDQLRAHPARGPRGAPGRADHLQQGRLGHVAGSVRPGRRVAQVRAGEPGPEPSPRRRRLRRHLLLAPLRPRHAARGDDGRAGHGGAPGQGPLRRDLVLLGGEDARGGRDPALARACRCSSTSRRTTCSTGGSSRTCSTPSTRSGAGMIAFTALAQGLLTDKYLDGIPRTRASTGPAATRSGGRCSTRRTWRGCARSTRSRSGAARPSPRWPTPGCCATRG